MNCNNRGVFYGAIYFDSFESENIPKEIEKNKEKKKIKKKEKKKKKKKKKKLLDNTPNQPSKFRTKK